MLTSERSGAGLMAPASLAVLWLAGSALSRADVVAIYKDRGAAYLQHTQSLLAKSDFD